MTRREPITMYSIESAWTCAGELFPTDYAFDPVRSERAGYGVFHSTAEGVNAWISDLGNRLELNYPDGNTQDIYIILPPKRKELERGVTVHFAVDAWHMVEKTLPEAYLEHRTDIDGEVCNVYSTPEGPIIYEWEDGIIVHFEDGSVMAIRIEPPELTAEDRLRVFWKDSVDAIVEAAPEGVSMTMDEFLNHCTACGGNWGGMLLTGIRELWPAVWEAIPEHMGRHAFEGIILTLELCGVTE